MAEPSGGYVYLPIADAKKSINMSVILFAKISEVGFPKKSKGTDYVLILKVVDQSCPLPGLSVTFFAENTKKLPNVRSAGDMISLHHVEMKMHNGEVCCLFGKRSSSFSLFNGKTKTNVNPYQTSPKYCFAEQVSDLLLQLRTLSFEHLSDAGLIKRISLLRNIEIGKTSDIICKVFHVCEISKDERILFVWDGTDLPPITLQTDLDVEKEKPAPLFPESLPLSKDILCSFPHEGSVLRIFADKFFEDIHHFRGGKYWVKLYNVTFEIQSGIWKGVVNSLSRVFILSDEDHKVKYRNRIHDERRATKLERLPLASFPEPSYSTDTDHKNAAYATLMDSITRPQVKFFGGNLSSEELTIKMNKLLGMEEPGKGVGGCATRNPPWIWCCLMSYYLDESDPWGSRRYRIFDTRLVD